MHAERVGLSRSVVARSCQAAGVARLPALQQGSAVKRYERKSAGELLHLDTKKLGCFERPGHRVTGDRTQITYKAGGQALHVAIDDHSRVGFSLMLADETERLRAIDVEPDDAFDRTAITGWWYRSAGRWA